VVPAVGFGTVRRVLEPAVRRASLESVTDARISAAEAAGLQERDRQILDFEREAWKLTVAKERAIRERFGLSATRYHQLLRRVLDRPSALAYDPMLVRRLRRVREARRRRRIADRLGVRM
jgi:hypothetical protein